MGETSARIMQSSIVHKHTNTHTHPHPHTSTLHSIHRATSLQIERHPHGSSNITPTDQQITPTDQRTIPPMDHRTSTSRITELHPTDHRMTPRGSSSSTQRIIETPPRINERHSQESRMSRDTELANRTGISENQELGGDRCRDQSEMWARFVKRDGRDKTDD